jgi:hypothetical protein
MGFAPILPVLLRLLVHDWYYVEFTKWALLPTPSTTPYTGSRLVLRRVYYMGFAPILPVLLHLLIHDCYYIKFTAWTSLPYFQYYSVYWFMAGTTSSLLLRPRSHNSSTTPSTGSRLVLHRVCCKGLATIVPLLLHLLVHD